MRIRNLLILVLMVVGAINWGLWGFFQYDLVAALFGGDATIPARVVYGLVGVAGVGGLGILARAAYRKECGCGCDHCCSSKNKSELPQNGCCKN